MTDTVVRPAATGAGHRARPGARVGILSAGLGTYWEQFPGLREELARQTDVVVERVQAAGAEVVACEFVSWPEESPDAGERLRAAGLDLLIVHLATYCTSSQVLPAVQRAGVPVLVVDLQPTAQMDHPNTDTGKWLAYCGVCSLPEMSSAFLRSGIDFRSLTGHLEDERSWQRIEEWVRAATVTSALRTGRFGLMGHIYPGMLDISTDPTLVSSQLGGHIEVLELDDLRVRVEAATDEQVAATLDRTRSIFDLDESVVDEDLQWAARCSVGLDAMVEDFRLDSLAYYYRGLGGDLYERLGAGLILGASLLTADGVPCAGEYDLRTSLAMLVMDRLGAGGSFTEFQALNFNDGVVEMGHDGPAHLAISSGKPALRGLSTYHGKRGYGVSVQFGVTEGPVTLLALTQRRDGELRMIVSEGTVVPGPLLDIGNTSSRVDFSRPPGEWVDAFCAGGPAHHWALGVGHHAATLQRVADLTGVEIYTEGL
jgi:L-arabinose isomerase